MSSELDAAEATLAGRREPYVRVTVVDTSPPTSGRPGDYVLVTADGQLIGWVGGSCVEHFVVRQALDALGERRPRLVRTPVGCASEGTLELFVEPRLPAPHLVAVGRSPLVKALAAMAVAVGFEVVVLERDDTDEGGVDHELEKAGVGPASFVVVATMGRYDEDAVLAALAAGAGYVGLVASARRAAAVAEALRAAGVPEHDLDRVHAPAGLDLGSLPHTEIAVAILAEIVALKARAP